MITCPNKKLKDWKNLVKAVGEDRAYLLWDEHKGNVPQQYYNVQNINESTTSVVDSIDVKNVTDLNVSENEDSMFDEEIIPTNNEDVENTQLTQNNKVLFNNQSKTSLNTDEVLKNILDSLTESFSENSNFFIRQLTLVAGKTGAKVKVVSSERFNELNNSEEGAVMFYLNSDNTIYISEDTLNTLGQEEIVQSFLHEVIHSIIDDAYNRGSKKNATFEEKDLKDFFDKAFKQYSNLTAFTDNEGKQMYGFTNPKEFIAEIFSNPKFQEELVEAEKNFFQKLINYIRRLFSGLNPSWGNDLIRTTVLFKEVEKLVSKGQNENQLFTDEISYKKRERFEIPKSENFDDILKNMSDQVLNNTEEILRRAQATLKREGKEDSKFVKDVTTLKHQIILAEYTNLWNGISQYTDFMISQIDRLFEDVTGETVKLDTFEDLEKYKAYLIASDLLKPLLDLTTHEDVKKLSEANRKIASELSDRLTRIAGVKDRVVSVFESKEKALIKSYFKNARFTQKVVYNFEKELRKEYKTVLDTHGLSLNEWVSRELTVNRSKELEDRIDKHVNDMLDGVGRDISSWDKSMYSTLNTNSKLIQLAQKLMTSDKLKVDKKITDYDFKLQELFSKFVKEKGNVSPSKMFKNILHYDSNGDAFILGDYDISFRDKYLNEYVKYFDQISKRRVELHAEMASLEQQHSDPELKRLFVKVRQWKIENLDKTGKNPASKYKLKNSNLSEIEKEFVEMYKELVEKSEKVHHGKDSLVRRSKGSTYYKLPSMTTSVLEKTLEGNMNVVAGAKRVISDFTTWQPEDLMQYQKAFDKSGREINQIPVLFRGKIEDGQQSLDIFTLMRMEAYNQFNYEQKENSSLVLKTLVDISKNKKYLKTEKGSNLPFLNLFGINVKHVEMQGVNSKTYERLNNIVNQHLYNIFNEETFKFRNTDMNKLTQNIQGWTGYLGMTLNYFSAPTNIINAEFQMMLMKVAKDLDSSALSQAHSEYVKDLPNIVADTGRPVGKSKINQLNIAMDIFGGLSHDQQSFIKNTLLKANGNLEILKILQSGGEHMVHSVLNIAILKSIKVLNDKNEYINKEGNKVNEDKASSLYDMVEQNDDSKQIYFSDKFTYTDKTKAVKWNSGGFENVRLYVKKKVFDTMGEFDRNFQTDFQRHWYGQLATMYKKFLVPLGITRFRGGILNAFKSQEDLVAEDMHWNESLQEYEEGYYITFARLLFSGPNKGLLKGLLNLKYTLTKWESLSDYEKSNVRKAILEFGTIALFINIICPLTAAMAAGADDDDDAVVYLALYARRFQQELSQYSDVSDAYKLTKTPIAALNTIEDIIDVVKFTTTPSVWTSRNKKDESRFFNAVEKIAIPASFRHDKTAKSVLNYSNKELFVPINETLMYKAYSDSE